MDTKRSIITPARTLAVFAILMSALLLLLPPVRSLAGDFLGLFRVEQVKVVTFNPEDLGSLQDPGELGAFDFEPPSALEPGTLMEAAKLVGFPLQMPSYLPPEVQGEPSVSLFSAGEFTFIPELRKINAYLELIGAQDVQLPEELDGATIVGRLPPTALVTYEYPSAQRSSIEEGRLGSAQEGTAEKPSGTMTISQTRSPTLEIDRPGIDLENIRQQILKLPMIPDDVRRQLEAVGDWRRTLVIPLPDQVGHAEPIKIRGTEGVIIEDESSSDSTVLMWPEDGKVLSIVAAGGLPRETVLRVAESLE